MAPEAEAHHIEGEGHHKDDAIHHMEEVHHMETIHELEQAVAVEGVRKKRHGLREYSSENGPLVHRDNSGRHLELQRNVAIVMTPTDRKKFDLAKEKEARVKEKAVLEGADLG